MICTALLTALGAMSAIGWAQWTVPIDTAPIQADGSRPALDVASLPTESDVFVPKPLAVFRETTARPLFSETRRPIRRKTVNASKPKPKPVPAHIPISQLRLTGVIVKGEMLRALIYSPSSPDGAWLAIDDVVGGWKILEIKGDFARLEADGESRKLQLYVDNKGITPD